MVEEDLPLNEQPDNTEHTQINNYETTDQNMLIEVDKGNLYRNQSIMKTKAGPDLTGGALSKKLTMPANMQVGLAGQPVRNTMPYQLGSLASQSKSRTEFKGL